MSFLGLESPFVRQQKNPYSLDKIIRADEEISFDRETLIRFLENNVACMRNNRTYLEFLSSKNINAFAHLSKNAERVRKLRDKAENYNYAVSDTDYLFHHFLDVEGAYELLEPFLSVFMTRLKAKLIYANYTVEDESIPMAEQQEVILYGIIKLTRQDNGKLRYHKRMGNHWVEFKSFYKDSLNIFNSPIKDKSFFNTNRYVFRQDLLLLLSRIVIAEMFNEPEFIYNPMAERYNTPSRYVTQGRDIERTPLNDLLSLFTDLINFHPNYVVKRPTDSQFFISPYLLVNSLRKVYWVMSCMINPQVCKYYTYLIKDKSITLSNHNRMVDQIVPRLEHFQRWENEHPNKLLLLLYREEHQATLLQYSENTDDGLLTEDDDEEEDQMRLFEPTDLISDPNALRYENVLVKYREDAQGGDRNGVYFYDKRCYQHCIRHVKKTVLYTLLKKTYILQHEDYHPIFTVWTHYFAYSKFKNHNSHVLNTIMFEMGNLVHVSCGNFLNDDRSKEFGDFLNKFVICMDVLYECLLNGWKKTKRIKAYLVEITNIQYREVVDYLCAMNHIDYAPDNILKATPSLTLNSIKRHVDTWHREMTAKKFDADKIIQYPHLSEFSTKYGTSQFELIVRNIDLYQEGQLMHHCVYTYDHSIRIGSYLVFKVQCGDERATLGVTLNEKNGNHSISFQQCFSYYNKPISEEMRSDALEFVLWLNANLKPWLDMNKINHDIQTVSYHPENAFDENFALLA